jgi:hypothetical protein
LLIGPDNYHLPIPQLLLHYNNSFGRQLAEKDA